MAANYKVRLALNQVSQAVPEDRVIVDDENLLFLQFRCRGWAFSSRVRMHQSLAVIQFSESRSPDG
jgi:hypothetical protein